MTNLSRKPLAAVATVSLVVGIFSACSDPYYSCDAKRACPEATGGEDGEAGDGTSNSGGSTNGGGRAASGGRSGASGGAADGGDDGGGGNDGGGAGANAGGGGDSNGATGGSSTEGGNGDGSGARAGGSDGSGGSAEGGSGGDDGGPRCGDGNVDDGEACDDGNDDAADGCRPNCTWGPKEIVAGGSSSCVLFGNGAAKCWGANEDGQLGQGDTLNRGDFPGQMGTALGFIEIDGEVAAFSSLDIAANFACGVRDGQAWCWGQAQYLGLGVSATTPVLQPVKVDVGGEVMSVTVAGIYACALLKSGDVKCWGSNMYGQLGIGSTAPIGDGPGEMGANLRRVELGARAVQVTCGIAHACAILETGGLACWGLNSGGQLWHGSTDHFGDDPEELEPPALDLGADAPVSDAAAEFAHSCAVLGGFLKCWGLGLDGELGLGTLRVIGSSPDDLTTGLPWVPVSTPLGSDPVVSVVALQYNTCALTLSGGVKCWGRASVTAQPSLQIVLGDNIGDADDELSTVPPIDFGPGAVVRSIASGFNHVCALLTSGEVKCWGFNNLGQLGLGNTETVGDDVAELGANMKSVELD